MIYIWVSINIQISIILGYIKLIYLIESKYRGNGYIDIYYIYSVESRNSYEGIYRRVARRDHTTERSRQHYHHYYSQEYS